MNLKAVAFIFMIFLSGCDNGASDLMSENEELLDEKLQMEQQIERLIEAKAQAEARAEKAEKHAQDLVFAGEQCIDVSSSINENTTSMLSNLTLTKGQGMTALHIIELNRIFNEAKYKFKEIAENRETR